MNTNSLTRMLYEMFCDLFPDTFASVQIQTQPGVDALLVQLNFSGPLNAPVFPDEERELELRRLPERY